MKRRRWLTYILPAKSTAICFVILLAGYSLFAQTGCSCPPLNTCSACIGGLTYLKMEYTPNNTIIDMKASDNDGILPSSFVGKQISINSRVSDEPFNGDVIVTVTKSNNTTDDVAVSTSCTSPVFVGDHIQNLQVVEAVSVGGPICCSDAKMDKVKPSLAGCPTDISVSAAPGGCTALVNWTPPAAADNCGNVTLSSTHSPGSAFSTGTTVVTYTATDDFNNSRTCSFNVIVTDTSPPVISNCPTNISVSSGTSCDAIVNWIEPTATDCSLQSFTSDHAPRSSFPIGTTTVTYTARDVTGNVVTCSFTVTVTDKTPPVFSNCPATIEINANQSCNALVNWTAPTATDNCTAATITSSHTPGSVFVTGITTVVYTATDGAGNSSQCQFDVIVSDVKASISNCVPDLTATADESGKAIVTWLAPNVISSCTNVPLVSDHLSGDSFPVGTTLVTYTLPGTGTTCQFNVIVDPIEVQIRFDVIQQVSPNGDGINDTWQLPNIEHFKNNRVILLDRWGGLVYEASGYDNESVVWNGTNTKGSSAPTGTYFYTITVEQDSHKVKRTGFIELIR